MNMQSRLMEIAREECRKRSLRLGYTERPGGVPNWSDRNHVTSADVEARNLAVLAQLADGPRGFNSIVNAIGNDWAVTAIARLRAHKRIRKTRNGLYEEVQE